MARDLAVVFADGRHALTDLGALRDQGVLFGAVAADATANRCVERLDAGHAEPLRLYHEIVPPPHHRPQDAGA